MPGTSLLDPVLSRDRKDGKKKVRRPVPNRTLTLKEAISELKDNYFLMLEDGPKCRQDNFQST